MSSAAVDVVIPSYNGGHLLQKHLLKVIKNTPNLQKLIIVDDGGTDDTAGIVAKLAPQAIVVRNSTNLGFTKSVNLGVQLVTAPYFVLLNNDVEPQPHYLTSPLELITNPKVAAVTFSEDKHSWPMVTFKEGKISFQEGLDRTQNRVIAWPSGGSCLIKLSVWQQLSGFNPIYSPGYWEDIDLGWRINKLGLQIIWDSTSKVIHQHESTFKNLNQHKMNLHKSRNELLFNWLNINSSFFKITHIAWLVKYCLLHPGYLRVVFCAIQAISSNRYLYKKGLDSMVFNKVNLPA